jgi:membrane protein
MSRAATPTSPTPDASSAATDLAPVTFMQLAKSTVAAWSDDHASRLAASFSYYAIFAIGPLLLIAISLLGFFFGPDAAGDKLRPQIAQFVGPKAADFIQDMIKAVHFSPGASLAGIISVVLILYAATNLFVSLQDALNTIFNVKPKPGRGVKGIIADRALSFVMVLIIGGVILASVVASTVLTGITDHLHVASPIITGTLIELANVVLSVVMFTVVFSMIFKILPDVEIDWKDTFIGAAVTAILFTIARLVLSLYLSRASVAGPYAAAGSLVVVLLFIYYATQVLFLGAEFTKVWAQRTGDPIEPAANAVSLKVDDANRRGTKKIALRLPAQKKMS